MVIICNWQHEKATLAARVKDGIMRLPFPIRSCKVSMSSILTVRQSVLAIGLAFGASAATPLLLAAEAGTEESMPQVLPEVRTQAERVSVGEQRLEKRQIEAMNGVDGNLTSLLRINPSVQAGSRSVLVYLRVPAQPGMRQGLFAQGSIDTGQLTALALPLSAVRNDKPQPYVQVLRDGQVRHVPLQPGAQAVLNGEPMRVVEGLPAGTVVLRAQAGLIREGTSVRVGATKAGTASDSQGKPNAPGAAAKAH